MIRATSNPLKKWIGQKINGQRDEMNLPDGKIVRKSHGC